MTGTPVEQLEPLEDAEKLTIGGFKMLFIHTPGHSPGSMCIHIGYALSQKPSEEAGIMVITGDTVFPGSCGRLDLPGSDPVVMYDSLRKLSALPDELPIFPGHGYYGWGSYIGQEKTKGLLQPMSRAQWERRMGIRSEL